MCVVLCEPETSSGRGGAAAAVKDVVVEVVEGAPLELECPLGVEARAEWKRDGRPLTPSDPTPGTELVQANGGGIIARLSAPAARASHAGLYTCGPRATSQLRLLVRPAAAHARGSDGDNKVVYYEVGYPWSINCSAVNTASTPVAWSINGTELDKLTSLSKRVTLSNNGDTFTVSRMLEDDYGQYKCQAGTEERKYDVRGKTFASLPKSGVGVVEGQKLKVTCRLVGKPHPAVAWWYSPDVDATDGQEISQTSLAERANMTNQQLVIPAAELTDGGVLFCAPLNETADAVSNNHPYKASTIIRVKGKYAALWPFLGIVAEVLILCIVIMVYEKRRSNPVLDDSDTDHDTKKS